MANLSFLAGCALCLSGNKMPIYITHRCNKHCSYCPVPTEYFGQDYIIVGDRPVERIDEIPPLLNAFHGASISGGEPLLVVDRVARTVRLLKDAKGTDFHVHLYSNGSIHSEKALSLVTECGLDEIRLSSFSPEDYIPWVKTGLTVAAEIPVFPDRINDIVRLAAHLFACGVVGMNLVELEVTKSNLAELKERGYGLDLERNVVIDSFAAAETVAKQVADITTGFKTFICSKLCAETAVSLRQTVLQGMFEHLDAADHTHS